MYDINLIGILAAVIIVGVLIGATAVLIFKKSKK